MTRLALLLSVTALVACADDSVPAAAGSSEPRAYAGTLAVDIRGSAMVRIDRAGDDATSVSIALDAVDLAGLFVATAPLSGDGRIERFPEADGVLYTAKLALPPSPSGACGAEPVSLALALHRSGQNARVGGALTAYCGAAFHGVPARVLRLSGELAPVP